MCSWPFRPYTRWVVGKVLEIADEGDWECVVELAAGSAPITKELAERTRRRGLRLVVCDLDPDREAFESLERKHPGRVTPVYRPATNRYLRRAEGVLTAIRHWRIFFHRGHRRNSRLHRANR